MIKCAAKIEKWNKCIGGAKFFEDSFTWPQSENDLLMYPGRMDFCHYQSDTPNAHLFRFCEMLTVAENCTRTI